MGRHADTTRRRGFRVPIGVVSIVVVVLCAVGLGVWWWSLKSATDPIDANPVDAYAIVVSSPTCSAGGVTTVRVSGTNPPVTATLDACGYRVGEQLPVQYLAGHPETVRVTGSSTAGAQSMAAKLLPIGILAAGVIAVLATIALLVERRRSRHQASRARRGTRRSGPAARQPVAGAVPGPVAAAAAGAPLAVADAGAAGAVDGPVQAAGPAEPQQAGLFPDEAFGSGLPAAVPFPATFAAPSATDEAIPAGPAVVIDDGILFTHSHPEPPEPAGAPVELSADGPQHLPPTVTFPAPDPD